MSVNKYCFDNLTRNETRQKLYTLLSLSDSIEIQELFDEAARVKKEEIGNIVHFRGLVELSNICTKDCYYCGIRKSNHNVHRFMMECDDIIETALESYKQNYGSMVLQAGERSDPEFVTLIETVLKEVKRQTNGKLGITLSLGEQTEETFQRWFDAGAHRYLLRIESSNPELYRKLHPASHSFETRIENLKILRKIGYQVGTGVLIGAPEQTIDDLVDDILFFKDIDIDMIGMGPYLPHPDTPFGDLPETKKEEQLSLALKTIATTRIFLKDVNIAATTALHVLDDKGREQGILAGGNIIMPNLTHPKYKPDYQLYTGKSGLEDSAEACNKKLYDSILKIGHTIGLNHWGDSKHFKKRSH
jgi:biotin synthase